MIMIHDLVIVEFLPAHATLILCVELGLDLRSDFQLLEVLCQDLLVLLSLVLQLLEVWSGDRFS